MKIAIVKFTIYIKCAFALIFCVCNFITLKAQYSKVSKEAIVTNRVSSMKGAIDITTSNGVVEEVSINEYEFDTKGRCIRKRIITPFIDVTSSSNEYYFTYDSLGNITKEIRISKSIGLTPQGENFISNFGNNEDTIVKRFIYMDGKLLKEILLKNNKRDSTIISYVHDGDLMISKTNIENLELENPSPGNFEIRYFYDDHKRLIREEMQPLESNHMRIKVIKYTGKSERKKSEEIRGAYGWSYYRSENGDKDFKVIPKSEVRYTEYTYDKDNILIMKRIYPDRTDAEKYYDLDKNNKRIPTITSNRDKDENGVFMRIYNELELVHDDNGLLNYEKRYRSNGEVLYICNYTYRYY